MPGWSNDNSPINIPHIHLPSSVGQASVNGATLLQGAHVEVDCTNLPNDANLVVVYECGQMVPPAQFQLGTAPIGQGNAVTEVGTNRNSVLQNTRCIAVNSQVYFQWLAAEGPPGRPGDGNGSQPQIDTGGGQFRSLTISRIQLQGGRALVVDEIDIVEKKAI